LTVHHVVPFNRRSIGLRRLLHGEFAHANRSYGFWSLKKLSGIARLRSQDCDNCQNLNACYLHQADFLAGLTPSA
jgi:hypothetical protein